MTHQNLRLETVMSHLKNASIGSHHVSWRVLGSAQHKFVNLRSYVK